MSDRMRLRLLKLHAFCLALVIPDASRWVPLTKLLAWFTPAETSRLYAGLPAEDIVATIERLLARRWRMRGRPCLREGLLGLYFLRKAGWPVVLNFGVYHTQTPRAQAHCWLTLDERILASPPQEPCAVVLRHGAAEHLQRAA